MDKKGRMGSEENEEVRSSSNNLSVCLPASLPLYSN